MDWIKKHTDTIAVLGAILSSVIWMNHQFREVDNRFSRMEKEVDAKFSQIEKDLAVIKTVLIMKEIMPNELAVEKN